MGVSACGGCEVACKQGKPQVLDACGGDGSGGCGQHGSRVQVHGDGVPLHGFYALGESIGEGGYGVVRKCRERRTGVIRACKTTAKAKGEAGLLCARMEVDILRALQRDGDRGEGTVVQLFEVFEDEQAVHIVLELCGGGELYHRQSSCGTFAESETKVLFLQMLGAIAHVHRHEVAHRDLKLENWLLTRQAPSLDLRLCDFGLSVFLRPGEVVSECVGSVYYVAPEVLNGSYDARVDIWSLGVIAYMLMSGLPPFNGTHQPEILSAILRGSVSFDAPVWRTVSSEARNVILQLLRLDPNARPAAEAALQSGWLQGVTGPFGTAMSN